MVVSGLYSLSILSTKHRYPFLHDREVRSELHKYLGGISKNLDCPPIIVGGVAHHIHLLARFGRTVTQADWVKELKRVSNLWLHQAVGLSKFQWQGGYADFSVSQSNLDEVRKYIENQEEHHRKMSFQDELRILLTKHDTTWDEAYIWE